MADFDPGQYKKTEREVYSITAPGYERHGSAAFEAYAKPLLDAAGLKPGQRVLDAACGPGIPSLAAASLVAPGGWVTGIDLAPGMVELARKKAEERSIVNVTFQEADTEELPLPEGSFDVVLCSHGLVHTTDRNKALDEMRRVLKKDGGMLALSVWSTPDRALVIGLAAKAIREAWPAALVPGAPMWFDFGPEGVLEKTLAERGFKDIRTDRFSVWLETANAEEYWETVVGISGRLQMLLESIPPDTAAKIKTAVLKAAEGFRAGDIIRIPCEEVIATCRA